jgi:formate dehydrogenase gamma subunit
MRAAIRLIVTTITLLMAGALYAETIDNATCLTCHDQVNASKFAASMHGSMQCTDCHADVTVAPHETTPKKVDCSGCHSDTVAAWGNSLHATAAGGRGPKCLDCHGSPHEILSSTDKQSATYHTNIPKTCSRCHAQKFVIEKAGLTTQPANSYQDSVHGRATARGSMRAAVCTDCHDSHNVLRGNNPQSGIFKFNVPRTCGKCHAAVAAAYGRGVHGKALAHGNWSTPVCTDCHGIHAITKVADPSRGPRASCMHCHEGVRLTQEFAVPAERVSSYASSYHGLAHTFGSKVAADCASCHGAHDILPSNDPKSAVNKANLPKTCGKCHQGAQANFGKGKIHITDGDVSDTPTRAVTWLRLIYIVLIVGTIGGMALHNIIIWVSKARAKRSDPNRVVVRMNRNQRIQHFILVVSFTVLVISGFALVWPGSVLGRIFGSGEQLRRWVHRIAAIVMIALGLYHMAYMAGTKEGRKGLRDFWFNFKDAKDAFGVIRYYLGLSKVKPQFGRFTYAEKAEYWAGMWGTIVMAVTGMVLWFSVTVTTWMPRWWIDIATTIHFYEGILATLAIIVWHLYHVIFDPDIYPVSWAWYDGKITKHQQEEEHGLEKIDEP